MAKWSRWVQIWQIYPPLLTSCGQDEFTFGTSTPRPAGRSTPHYWHLVVKMSSNLADLPLDLPADLPPIIFHSYFLSFLELQKSLLVSFQWCWTQWQSGQDEFKFGRSMPTSAGRSTPITDILWSRWVQIWQIYPQYWHLVVKMSSHLAHLPLDLLADLAPPVLTSHGQGEFKFGRSYPPPFIPRTPEIQKSLLVSFQGCWTQWQRFESSSIHLFWDSHNIFSKHIFAEKVASFHS